MKILGIKLTHDGGLALIDDGELVFSYEMEKLNNFNRYSPFRITSKEVSSILSAYGYDMQSIDRIVIDGWDDWDLEEIHSGIAKKFTMTIDLGGRKKTITTADLAGYGHIIRDDDEILRPAHFAFEPKGLSYTSYLHISSHIAGAYCTSQFSGKGEDAYILIWDGGTPPQLFYYKYRENKFINLGPLFPLMGYIYMSFSAHFKPFSQMTYGLSIAGKAMAYMALGKIQPEILQSYRKIFQRLTDDAGGTEMEVDIAAIITQRFTNEAKQAGIANGYGDEDMLTTFQEFLRELLVQNLSEKVRRSPEAYTRNLCMAGGCALNIKWNSAIRNSRLFSDIWVPPFPNDAGSAIGTACCEMLVADGIRSLKWNVYSGPRINHPGTGSAIDSGKVDTHLMINCTVEELADILHRYDEPVVFLNGAAELGPRALGNRSILAPASSPDTKARLNDMKNREDYRPVAPICLEEYAADIFTPGSPDPHMLFEHTVKPAWKQKVPAVCHLDDTARLQTVNAAENDKIYRLLTAYHRLSGIPLLCNTSANLNGSGFFPDVNSALKWNKANLIWCEDTLYIKKGFTHAHDLCRKELNRTIDRALL